jgi:hypothetical protein
MRFVVMRVWIFGSRPVVSTVTMQEDRGRRHHPQTAD